MTKKVLIQSFNTLIKKAIKEYEDDIIDKLLKEGRLEEKEILKVDLEDKLEEEEINDLISRYINEVLLANRELKDIKISYSTALMGEGGYIVIIYEESGGGVNVHLV